MILSGWGRYPLIHGKLSVPRSLEELRDLVLAGKAIARGNGRSYGDSAASVFNTIHMRKFDRFISFDNDNGLLVTESGAMLSDVIDTFIPRGWFPYVTPGTKFVSIGGLLASDVHGKNHHKEGSFSNYVEWIDLMTPSGDIERCSSSQNKELFEWTLGGMGLTGVILRAAIKLRPIDSAWIDQQTIPADNLETVISLFEQHQDSLYSVAWIDCLQHGEKLGRSLLMLGRHADVASLPQHLKDKPFVTPRKRKVRIPLDFPSWFLNGNTVRAFNWLYYFAGKRKQGRTLVDYDTYFYPLDSILDWNKVYGRHGFIQFQCVIPLAQSEAGLRSLLEATSRAACGSFLAVLKRFGDQKSKFAFPMEGYTLALDFPVGASTRKLISELEEITLTHGGRIYLAKDSVMSSDLFKQLEPRAEDYANFRKEVGAFDKFISEQSRRLKL